MAAVDGDIRPARARAQASGRVKNPGRVTLDRHSCAAHPVAGACLCRSGRVPPVAESVLTGAHDRRKDCPGVLLPPGAEATWHNEWPVWWAGGAAPPGFPLAPTAAARDTTAIPLAAAGGGLSRFFRAGGGRNGAIGDTTGTLALKKNHPPTRSRVGGCGRHYPGGLERGGCATGPGVFFTCGMCDRQGR